MNRPAKAEDLELAQYDDTICVSDVQYCNQNLCYECEGTTCFNYLYSSDCHKTPVAVCTGCLKPFCKAHDGMNRAYWLPYEYRRKSRILYIENPCPRSFNACNPSGTVCDDPDHHFQRYENLQARIKRLNVLYKGLTFEF